MTARASGAFSSNSKLPLMNSELESPTMEYSMILLSFSFIIRMN